MKSHSEIILSSNLSRDVVPSSEAAENKKCERTEDSPAQERPSKESLLSKIDAAEVDHNKYYLFTRFQLAQILGLDILLLLSELMAGHLEAVYWSGRVGSTSDQVRSWIEKERWQPSDSR